MAGAEQTHANIPLGRIYLLILLTTVLWGGNPVAGKLAIRGIPPMTVGVLRYGVASLVLITLFRRYLPAWRELRRRDRWVLLGVGSLGTFLNHILFFLGLVFAPAWHGAILAPTTSPIWTMLLAARLAGERITRAQIAGTALCMMGVILIIRPVGLDGMSTSTVLLGDLFYLLGGMAWGAYSFMSKIAMRRMSALATLAYAMVMGCLLLVPAAIAERPWTTIANASASAWASVLYLTVAGTLLAFFWWNLAIQRVGAGRTAVFTNLVPVFGVLLSWGILGERLTAIQLLGGALTLAGVWVCQGPAALQAAWRQARVRLWRMQIAEPEKR